MVLETRTSYVSACSGSGGEAYFVWMCPHSGTYSIDTHGSDFDTVLSYGPAVECHFDYESQACNDDLDPALTSELVLSCDAGQSFTIVVDSYGREAGDFQLHLLSIAQGDDCPVQDLGEALGNPVATGTVAEGYSGVPSMNLCNAGSPRLGFTWTVPHTGPFVIDTFGSTYDTVLSLLDRCEGEVLACNDDSGGSLRSAMLVELTQGSEVVIEISAFSGNVESEEGGSARYVLNINDAE